MTRVTGIRWRQADPITFLDAAELELRRNNQVVVQAKKGQEFVSGRA